MSSGRVQDLSQVSTRTKSTYQRQRWSAVAVGNIPVPHALQCCATTRRTFLRTGEPSKSEVASSSSLGTPPKEGITLASHETSPHPEKSLLPPHNAHEAPQVRGSLRRRSWHCQGGIGSRKVPRVRQLLVWACRTRTRFLSDRRHRKPAGTIR